MYLIKMMKSLNQNHQHVFFKMACLFGLVSWIKSQFWTEYPIGFCYCSCIGWSFLRHFFVHHVSTLAKIFMVVWSVTVWKILFLYLVQIFKSGFLFLGPKRFSPFTVLFHFANLRFCGVAHFLSNSKGSLTSAYEPRCEAVSTIIGALLWSSLVLLFIIEVVD